MKSFEQKPRKIPDAIQLDISFDDKKELINTSLENKEPILNKQELDELYSGNDSREEFEKYNNIKKEQSEKHNISQQNPKKNKKTNKKFIKDNSVEAILRRNLYR